MTVMNLVLLVLVLVLLVFNLWFHRFANRYLRLRRSAVRLCVAQRHLPPGASTEYVDVPGKRTARQRDSSG